jgi:hypothetical protein
MIDLLSTSQPFQTWLSAKEPQQEVGMGKSPYNCPVVNFLMEEEVPTPTVSVDLIWSGNVFMETPDWLVLFIVTLDAVYGEATITAQEALSVLEETHEYAL